MRVLTVVLFATALLYLPAAVIQAQAQTAEAETDAVEEESESRHSLSVFVGGTSTEHISAFTLGLDYQYRVTPVIGVGALFDHAFGEIKSTIIGAALFLHFKQWEGTIAPAAEFHGDSEEEAALAFRFGLGYEIELGSWKLVPSLLFHTERGGEPALVYGVAFGVDL